MLTYNRKKFIPRAIQSVLSQSREDFEFIIVNNGSTDNTQDILNEYCLRDKRIKVINLPKSSIGIGRNVGIKASCGKYVSFVDDDDYLEKDALKILSGIQEKYSADIVTCGTFKHVAGKCTLGIYYDELKIMDNVEAVFTFLERGLYSAGMPAKLFSREILEKENFEIDKRFEDIWTTYKFFVQSKVVAACGLPLYNVVRHNLNTSRVATEYHLLNDRQLEEYMAAFQHRTDYITRYMPQLADFAWYSEYSYLISMVEKINRYSLSDCQLSLPIMCSRLKDNYERFYGSIYCKDFEKKWLEKYIGV